MQLPVVLANRLVSRLGVAVAYGPVVCLGCVIVALRQIFPNTPLMGGDQNGRPAELGAWRRAKKDMPSASTPGRFK